MADGFYGIVMKHVFSCLLLLVVAISGLNAQNLVTNPSFETYSPCPNGASAVANATGWQTAKNSPEYLNSCSSSIYSDVPTNYFGFQNASTGNAYMGGLFYGSFLSSYLADLREFFTAPLTSPMVVGQTYYVSFKINLCDFSPYAINRAGVQFGTTYNSNYPLNNTADVYTNTVITDKVAWTDVLGTFVPSVAYNRIYVGNFFQDVNCTVQYVGTTTSIGYHSYCFVDDVYVSTTPPVPLSIHWVSAGAEVAGHVATVRWELEGEDIDFYILESSDDGYAFREGHALKAAEGQRVYSQLDTLRNPMPTTFYRVRAVAKNGNTHLSPVIEAKRYHADIDFLLAYPSPVQQGGQLTVEYNSTSGQAAAVQVISIDGKVVRTETFPDTEPGHHEFPLSVQDLAPGAYLLKTGSLTRKFMVVE